VVFERKPTEAYAIKRHVINQSESHNVSVSATSRHNCLPFFFDHHRHCYRHGPTVKFSQVEQLLRHDAADLERERSVVGFQKKIGTFEKEADSMSCVCVRIKCLNRQDREKETVIYVNTC